MIRGEEQKMIEGEVRMRTAEEESRRGEEKQWMGRGGEVGRRRADGEGRTGEGYSEKKRRGKMRRNKIRREEMTWIRPEEDSRIG